MDIDATEDGRRLFNETSKKYKRKEKYNPRMAHMSAFLAQRSYEHGGRSHGLYKYKPHWSSDRISVHQHGKHVHVAIRGSDFLSASRGLIDLANDAFIAGGISAINPEFNSVKREVNNIIDFHKYKYGLDTKVTLSGHSLGGSMVNHIMSDPEIRDKVHESHSFNPGHGLPLMGQSHPKHHHIHHNRHDVVNMLGSTRTGASYHYHDSGASPINILGAHWNEDWENRSYWEETAENQE